MKSFILSLGIFLSATALAATPIPNDTTTVWHLKSIIGTIPLPTTCTILRTSFSPKKFSSTSPKDCSGYSVVGGFLNDTNIALGITQGEEFATCQGVLSDGNTTASLACKNLAGVTTKTIYIREA